MFGVFAKERIEYVTNNINNHLLNELLNELSDAVCKVLTDTPEEHPGKEILAAFAAITAQVAIENGIDKNAFIDKMADLYDKANQHPSGITELKPE